MLASSSKYALNSCIRVNARGIKSAAVPLPPRPAQNAQPRPRQSQNQRPQNSSNNNQRRPVRPWNFDQGEGKFKVVYGARSAEYNIRMRNCIAQNRTGQVVEIVAEMKQKGHKPDVSIYNNLLNALALERMHVDAWAVYADMIVMGITPNASTFLQLFYAHAKQNSDVIYSIWDEMEKHEIKASSQIYDFLIGFYLSCENLEMGLCKMTEMTELGFTPSLRVAGQLIDACGNAAQVRLALDIADAYEANTIRRLDSEVWVNLLISCAEHLYAAGVQRCWAKVVTELKILPDEGLCQLVLHTAARHGLPPLASDAIRQLETHGVPLQEYHFAPLLDALVANGQLKEAFSVLSLMRTAKVDPTLETAKSIVGAVQRDPELIDAAYSLLEELHREGKPVDVLATNALIQASSSLRDLQRAVGIYKAMPTLGIEPTIQTYELLLSACHSARHAMLGAQLFAEVRGSGLAPSATLFSHNIALVLTQTDYEAAFFHLEEMKAAGFAPGYLVYEEIVKTCVSHGDGRWKLAVEELEQAGFKVSARLERYIESGGKEWVETFKEDEKLPFEARKKMWKMRERDEGGKRLLRARLLTI